ncbi:MAG TPA: hypothetical protein VL995_04880 [Cellvibrio sp.]|nr:hypothetical protein [Cellvibrio sp.]
MVRLVNGSDNYHASPYLTGLESEWLNDLPHSAGLMVTHETQRWWRSTRLCSSAPLSMRLLEREHLPHLINEYMVTQPVRSLFFAAELEQFCEFLVLRNDVSQLVKTLVQFEVAMRHAHQVRSGCLLKPAYFAIQELTHFHFFYHPTRLLFSLLHDQPMPTPEKKPVTVLVSPAFTQLWHLASEQDVEKFYGGLAFDSYHFLSLRNNINAASK